MGVGAYSRWVLIRGLTRNRINTVHGYFSSRKLEDILYDLKDL